MLAGVALLAFGCGTLKTYFSRYSGPSKKSVVEEGHTFTHLPPAEQIESVTEKNRTALSQPASTPAASENDRTRAAAEAVAASAAALRASEEAAKAAAEASRAAARAAGTAAPLAQPTPAPPMLSSTNKADQEPERQHAAEMIKALNRAMRAVDRQNLGADGQSRKELAEKFLQSAQKAFAEGNYTEALSLADKASIMIAPLTTTPNSGSQ